MTTDRQAPDDGPEPHPDVLVIGAGPAGLTLAAQLRAFGARVRLVDRQPQSASWPLALYGRQEATRWP